MEKSNLPKLCDIHTIIFDFDGIFTNNKVYFDQNGNEIVVCDKSDSLGFDILKKYIKKNNHNIRYFVLSKEKNDVVSKRCKKLNINCFNGIDNKVFFINEYLSKKINNNEDLFRGIIYLGNDLNDLEAMRKSGFSVAPSDANKKIKEVADLVINKKGGRGFIREFIEKLLNLDSYNEKELISLINQKI